MWKREGPAHVAARVLGPVARRITRLNDVLEVRPADVRAADLELPTAWPSSTAPAGGPYTVNWVTTPPSAGSGGHTTMFRLISHLTAQGHRCRIYLYDVYGGDLAYNEAMLRDGYPNIHCEVHDALDGMADADAVFATSWPTAYVAFNDRCAGKRFYLVQDFEPFFYPKGTRSALAENTYRMGFHAVTAGRWLAELLARDYGMATDSFDFGCDADHYSLVDGSTRNGIVFYARRDAPRRAFELGILALELFAAMRPDIEIHCFGEKVGALPFAFVDHGLVAPGELNAIYNRCFAGLCLSMTNVSLVPHEMLAAGCVPVVNDADHNRIVLANDNVEYAAATPHALAAALRSVVERPGFDDVARTCAASVQSASWERAGEAVEQVLRTELSTPPGAPEAIVTAGGGRPSA